ncbi:MAG: hypothetical protein Q9183_003247 [Haloplaca sp. 2 TL-2023]
MVAAMKRFGDKLFSGNGSGNNDETHQFRIDAGEVVDGKQMFNLQLNSEAQDPKLKKYLKKHGAHKKLATGSVDINTPKEQQRDVAADLFDGLEAQVRESLDE